MKSAHKPIFLVVSNNQQITELIKKSISSKETTVVSCQTTEIDKINLEKTHYIIYVLQRSYQDQDSTTTIINLYGLARDHQSKLAVIDIHKNEFSQDKIEQTSQLLNQLSAKSPLFRYILTKDIFHQDDQIVFALEQDILQATTTQKVSISTKGLNQLFPLNLTDLTAALMKSLFLERINGKKLTIIGDPINDLDLSYIIKDELEKAGKTLNIDTVSKDYLPQTPVIQNSAETRALLQWLPSDSSEEKLKRKISRIILGKSGSKVPTFSVDKRNQVPPRMENSKKPKRISLHKIEKRFLITIPVILTIVSTIILGVITLAYAFFISISLKETKRSLNFLNQGDSVSANSKIQSAQKYLQIGEDISHYIVPVYQLVVPKLNTNANSFSSLIKHSQSTIQSIIESNQLANNLYHDLFTPSGKSSSLDLSLAIQSRLRSIHQELSQIEIISQNHPLPDYFNNQLSDLDFNARITILRNQTAQSLKLLESFSSLLGTNQTHQIAILIQDPNELKSTGGIIRAIVLANVENQKITNIRILSAGKIDQQMDGAIQASSVIKTITGQSNLSFSNSNISSDFPTTAVLIEKFLNNSISVSPDLIIGLTTNIFSDITAELGSLTIGNLTYNANNFSEQMANSSLSHTASHATVSLTEQIVGSLQTQEVPLIKFARPLINTVNSDNLRVWFKDSARENSIINTTFAGSVNQYNCHPLLNQNNCFSDIAFLSENNFSVAPLNFFSTRQLLHQATIQEESILHSFNLNYKFENVPKELNRDYQVLYQIFLHKNAQFVSLEKDGQIIKTETERNIQNLVAIFQIPLTIKTTGETSIKINFVINDPIPSIMTSDFSYSLKTYHQPGTDVKDNQIIINYPLEYIVSSITSSATIGPEKIIYQPTVNTGTDTIIGIGFSNTTKRK